MYMYLPVLNNLNREIFSQFLLSNAGQSFLTLAGSFTPMQQEHRITNTSKLEIRILMSLYPFGLARVRISLVWISEGLLYCLFFFFFGGGGVSIMERLK